MKQKINCKFQVSSWLERSAYTCWIQNQNIIEDAELEFNGDHKNGKSNIDVTALFFYDCIISKVPQELTKTFPNIRILDIFLSKLKHIERNDLKDLSQLEILSFRVNEITYLPDDLLTDLKNLEAIDFYRNKIKIIEPNLLNGLSKLAYVNFSLNPCIDMKFDSIKNRSSETLKEIKLAIRQNYMNQASAKLKQNLESENDKIDRVTQTDNLKNFTIKVQDEEFKVHKLVLAARSSVLSKMIESNVDGVSLKLDSISAEVFLIILNFIYTDKLPESDDINLVDLFMAADKLKIDKLKEFAADKLIEKINAENAFEMLTLANKHEHQKLKCKSFEEIKIIFDGDDIDEELVNQPDLLKEAVKCKKESDNNLAKMSDILKNNSRKRKSDCISRNHLNFNIL